MPAETGAIGNELYSWLMMSDASQMTTTAKTVKDMGGNISSLYLGIGKVGINEAVAITATSTELNYVDGVTSAIQTQLDAKLSSATAASTYLTQANAASSYQPLDADLTTLAGLTATTDNFIVSVSSAWASRTPAQVKTTLSLNNVENTALSTWAGSSNITTLGTISTGTWQGTTIAVAKGGTGLTALGSGLQVLRTNAGATAMEWATISAGGGDLLASNNLSDLTNFATARTNLGLAIGTNVQAYSANLTTYAGIAPSANVQTLLGSANYSAFRTSLGVAIGSDVQAYSAILAAVAGGTYTGDDSITTVGTVTTGTWNATPIAVAKGGTGLTALGSGLQVLRTNAGATAMEWATISAGGGDLLASNNLSDLTNFATARTNLGLAIGTNVQAYSANLTTYAGIAPSANVQTLLGSANYSAFRTSLGVAIGSDVQAYSAILAAVAGGTYTGDDSITTVGTVTTGTWNATPIDYSKGGSGLTSFTALSIAVTNTANTRTQIAPSAGQAVRINSAGSAWEAYQTQFTKNFDISNWAMAVDSSGNCIMEDSFVKQSNDRYYGKRIIMKDSGTKTGLGVSFTVPSDYVGSAYLCIVWMSTATSGNNVVFDVDYTCNAKTGVTGDPSSDEENATATTADSTTSMQRVVTEIALTSANLSANQQFAGNISRDGASGSDTLAADIVIENIYLKYNNY